MAMGHNLFHFGADEHPCAPVLMFTRVHNLAPQKHARERREGFKQASLSENMLAAQIITTAHEGVLPRDQSCWVGELLFAQKTFGSSENVSHMLVWIG